ncbi:unnamed protein product [Rotaria magnacalcarata]|uniref:SH2 domain-containing protein n=2 Tax=Rotaria magnacalcarata TaxID=392030 RepID=A0A816FZA8_9BILA|nr:unnamed protein product [Rotaria magnacalcarata]CAF1668255.1 unnamed protein product [Rotaria magnacalcarata]CAF2006119.1 unnamed protein product [Rotaria magnacalcarata]CAF2104057.1 unnamed protein product [Rotaria magnacalcarata]CAF4000485.1 unnamed protein product [Rotaria magnacalcarata]
MSPIKTAAQSSFQACSTSEESYCSPWDLKLQEEKFKLLNEQHQISLPKPSAPLMDDVLQSPNINNQSTSLTFNRNHANKLFHPTCSVRQSSSTTTRKSLIHFELLPPELPPLPPGGLVPSCPSSTNNNTHNENSIIDNLDLPSKGIIHGLTQQKICSGTDTSRSFLFAVTSPCSKRSKNVDTTTTKTTKDDNPPTLFAAALLRFKHLSSSVQNNSLYKIETAYEQPWDKLQTSFLNNLSSSTNRNGGSLQKIPFTEQKHQRCSYSDDTKITPIDRYFWYHHTMSRRQAENVLEFRSHGSFLVRQSESGNQNDYSLSIKTMQGCMHMRICYSAGFYILGECSRPFSSVPCMIKYFSQVSVPIRGATHIKLGTPVLRWEILSTSSWSNEEVL